MLLPVLARDDLTRDIALLVVGPCCNLYLRAEFERVCATLGKWIDARGFRSDEVDLRAIFGVFGLRWAVEGAGVGDLAMSESRSGHGRVKNRPWNCMEHVPHRNR
jgi:hypothetical protein